MRIRLTTGGSSLCVLAVALAAVLLALPADAAGGIKNLFKGGSEKVEPEPEVDIFDLSLEDNIYQPEPVKNNELIADFQLREARDLKKKGYMVELMREGEVIVLTIPAGQLFAPNDTVLSDLGKRTLKPLLKYTEKSGMWKMLLVMHTDNTGSEAYLRALSRARVDAAFAWIDNNGNAENVVPYALGPDEPLKPNNSIDNRRQNRRLEVYLVPGKVMVTKAQGGKID